MSTHSYKSQEEGWGQGQSCSTERGKSISTRIWLLCRVVASLGDEALLAISGVVGGHWERCHARLDRSCELGLFLLAGKAFRKGVARIEWVGTNAGVCFIEDCGRIRATAWVGHRGQAHSHFADFCVRVRCVHLAFNGCRAKLAGLFREITGLINNGGISLRRIGNNSQLAIPIIFRHLVANLDLDRFLGISSPSICNQSKLVCLLENREVAVIIQCWKHILRRNICNCSVTSIFDWS